jgi:hypothetical protein
MGIRLSLVPNLYNFNKIYTVAIALSYVNPLVAVVVLVFAVVIILFLMEVLTVFTL